MANPPPGDLSLTAASDQIQQAAIGVSNDRISPLAGGAAQGATSISPQHALSAPVGVFVGVGVTLNTCEIKAVSSNTGGTLGLAQALTYAHAANERVEVLTTPYVPYWWFGIAADGVTNDRFAVQQAALQFGVGTSGQANNLIFDGYNNVIAISGPVVWPNESRRARCQFVVCASTSFFPADLDNCMIVEQGGGYPIPNTFTISGGVLTTGVGSGMLTGSSCMLWNTTGLAGPIEGRVYYAIKSGATFTLASTYANAVALTADVTLTAGSGTIFCGLQDVGRSYVDEELITPCTTNGGKVGVPGVNGYRRNGQQPGYLKKPKFFGAMPCYAPGTIGLLSAGLGTGGPITSISVKATDPTKTGISQPLTATQQITVWQGIQSQVFTVSANTPAGATSIPVNSQTPNNAYPQNTSLVQVAPVALTPGGGGTMVAGNYQVTVTYLNWLGESLPGPVQTVAVGASGTLQVSSPPAMQNNSDTNVKSSNATGWNVYISQAGGTTPSLQNGAPLAIGSPFTITAPPSLPGGLPPTISTAGNWNAALAYQQYEIQNMIAGNADVGILACGIHIVRFIGGLDIEQIYSYGIRTMPNLTFGNTGAGIFGCSIDGIHAELSNNVTTNWLDLGGNASGAGANAALKVGHVYLARGAPSNGLSPTGAFINNPNSVGDIEVGPWGDSTLPGIAGYLLYADPVKGSRDATTYNGIPPPLKIPPNPPGGGEPIRTFDVITNKGAEQLSGLAIRRVGSVNANYNQLPGDTYIGFSGLTTSRTLTLASAGLYGGGGASPFVFVADEDGSASASVVVHIAPKSGETINGSASSFNLNAARAIVLLISNSATNWTAVLLLTAG